MTRTRRQITAPRGFSLIEVLMAIFILGIGAISIAALFPAGIAQQRQSSDDVMGPIVANNAFEILRTKLSQEDFGDFNDPVWGWGIPYGSGNTWFETVEGDWGWIRPTYIFEPGCENGAIDVFSYDFHDGVMANRSAEFAGGFLGSSPVLYGVPYSRFRYPGAPGDTTGPPRLLFTQGERSYPQYVACPDPDEPSPPRPRSQYVWDCMFRKFQGKVLVAIFVYRTKIAGGEQAAYVVAPEEDIQLPPLPIYPPPLGTVSAPEGAWDPYGLDGIEGTADDAFIAGLACDEYEAMPFDRATDWQQPGQWILDQNNNVHRVLSAYCDEDDVSDAPRVVELLRPVPTMPAIGPYWLLDATDPNLTPGQENVVSDIWYLPLTDANDVALTPVYVTVKEL